MAMLHFFSFFGIACTFVHFSGAVTRNHVIEKRGQNRMLLKTEEIAQPNYTIYLHKEELFKQIDALVSANRGTFSEESHKAGDSDYRSDIKVITVDLGGINSSKAGKVRYLIDFGQHGREIITSELGLRFMRTLADPVAVRAMAINGIAAGDAKRGEELMKKVMEQALFKIVPMENVGGRDLFEDGKLCERKNGRGVDPNRNWEVDWGKKEKDYDPNEEFPGTSPFSEPETLVILGLAKALKPHVWLNVHSGMEALFTPWDHKAEVPPRAQHALAILEKIHSDFFSTPEHKECKVGSGGKSVGYLAHGTATDFMFERLGVPISSTWEIFGDLQADYHDCFKMFNPIDETQFNATLSVWLKALFRLIELAPSHPSIAEAVAKDNAIVPEETIPSPSPSSSGKDPTDSKPASHTSSDNNVDDGAGGKRGAENSKETEVMEQDITVVSSWVDTEMWKSLNWIKFAIGLVGLGCLIVLAVRYVMSGGGSSVGSGGGRGGNSSARNGGIPL